MKEAVTVLEAKVGDIEPKETLWPPSAVDHLRFFCRCIVQAVIGEETPSSREIDCYFEMGFTLPGRG